MQVVKVLWARKQQEELTITVLFKCLNITCKTKKKTTTKNRNTDPTTTAKQDHKHATSGNICLFGFH